MNKVLIAILIILAAESMAYLIVAYAYFDFNPAHWDNIDRSFSAIVSGVIGIVVAGGYLTRSKEID